MTQFHVLYTLYDGFCQEKVSHIYSNDISVQTYVSGDKNISGLSTAHTFFTLHTMVVPT
jgi:hypothetical protein